MNAWIQMTSDYFDVQSHLLTILLFLFLGHTMIGFAILAQTTLSLNYRLIAKHSFSSSMQINYAQKLGQIYTAGH